MKRDYTINSPSYLYWKAAHANKERKRLQAMARGEPAQYGYFKDRTPPPISEPMLNDEPCMEYILEYRLDCTYKEANQAIFDKETPVNLIIDGSVTYANALKLPRWTWIRDINGRWCLFNGLFYKII